MHIIIALIVQAFAFMGNATTFEKAIVNCVPSQTHAADLVFCVKGEEVNMTEYLPYDEH